MEDVKFLDNVNSRVIDELKIDIKRGSKLKIIAASFSIYAFEALKDELEDIDELKFIFKDKVFTKEEVQKTAREFYIPRLNRERSLYGNDFEIKLRNQLTQKAIAKECAEWIREKVQFRANNAGGEIQGLLISENQHEIMNYSPFSEFSISELGIEKGKNVFSSIIKTKNTRNFIDLFESAWNSDIMEDVKDIVLDKISAAYKENSPEFIYFITLYNIFSEFLDDINEDNLPNEATGFKNSKIWNTLYDFQKDAVVGCISKLEKHNGCILADSVGLGKTFSALGVIKYYESRNKNVLVLCPKRLSENWNAYKGNYKNNPLLEDRLRYEVLFHTDLGRERGFSNGIDLSLLNWGNYDLVVIDESHNFRNGARTPGSRADESRENRYVKLMNKVIKSGVKTKVLMLSATPVNTQFSDLKNQLMLASEGDSNAFDGTLDIENPIDKIFIDADSTFREWGKLPREEQTLDNLLGKLSNDFFTLLDSVTIARSRKHIQKYYKNSNIGDFPERLKPKSIRPELTDLDGINFDIVAEMIYDLNLEVYNPLRFVLPSKLSKYVDFDTRQAASWQNRESGRNVLMRSNLLKRIESSVHAFRITVGNVLNLVNDSIGSIEEFEKGKIEKFTVEDQYIDDLDAEDQDAFSVGKELKIQISDMDYKSWKNELLRDKEIFENILNMIEPVRGSHDLKLKALFELIENKIKNPINANNKKLIIFTAFSNTADYIYDGIADEIFRKYGLHAAIITGSSSPRTTLKKIRPEFNEVLTYFSPKSKNRDLINSSKEGDIDILIATDCISEGQNLQDCDYLVNYDIHWNPVRIIQRFGRIDRLKSENKQIQLVNFWPNVSLDDYIKLKARVEGRMKIVNMAGSASDNPLDESDPELEYRKKQLQKIQEEVVDIEDMNAGISIMDLGLNEFHLDLQSLLQKYGDADKTPHGIHSVVAGNEQKGVFFVLKNINSRVNIKNQNRIHPFYAVFISDTGEIMINHLQVKELLNEMRFLSRGRDKIQAEATKMFNYETDEGKNMGKYTNLLSRSIQSMIEVNQESELESLFSLGETNFSKEEISGLDDFEIITFLVVK